MLQMIGRVGKGPSRLTYRDFRVERKGFLSVLSYEIAGARRFDMLERGHAAVILPIDRRTRELYMLAEIRAHKPFGATERGRAWVRQVLRDGAEADATFEIPAEEARIFEASAGMIDADPETGELLETPKTAAVRELREETGLAASEEGLIHVGTWFSSIGGSCEMIHGFFADLPADHAETRGEPRGDGSEEMDIYRMTWDDAFDLLAKGKIETSSTWVMLAELKLRMLEGRI